MRFQTQFFTCLFFIFLSVTLQAQDPNHRFGKVDEAHVSMTTYEPDPEAGAVILYSRGDRYYELVNDKLRLVYVFHKRIKILSETAQHLADVEVPYYSYNKNESVTEIKGITYHVDASGKIESQKLAKSAIFREELNEFRSKMKFSMPNVKVGAVIEYQYKIYSYDFGSMRTWYFQGLYPTIYSESNLGRPDGFNYAPTVLGEYYPIEQTVETYRSASLSDGDRNIYIARNIPAFVKVPYLRAVKNHLLRLEMKLVNINIPGSTYKSYNQSWEQLNQNLVDNTSFKVTKNPGRRGKMIAELVVDGEKDPTKAAEKIYSYIRENYTWNKRFSMFPFPKISNLGDKKEGNGTSLNLLMIAALRAAGIEAYPVLVSTRWNGISQNLFPTLKQFNHSIVRVVLPDEKHILLDLTSTNTPMGLLPIYDLNDLGMQLSVEGPSWISLKPTQKADHSTRCKITIDVENESLAGEVSCTDKGYAALACRRDFHDNEIEEDEEKYVSNYLMVDFGDYEVGEVNLSNTTDISEPFKASFNFTTEEYVQMTSDRIYLQPLLHLAEDENPFKKEERRYMIDFTTPIREKAIITYQVPEGWAVEEVPKAVRIAIPERGAMFTYQVMNMGGQIQIMSDLQINEAVFSPDMYPYLRQFMDQVVAKQGEQIVLKRE